MQTTLTLLTTLLLPLTGAASSGDLQKAEMAGYLLVSSDKVPDACNAGFSLYAAAWPLLQHYVPIATRQELDASRSVKQANR